MLYFAYTIISSQHIGLVGQIITMMILEHFNAAAHNSSSLPFASLFLITNKGR